jgi:hypothetical protein
MPSKETRYTSTPHLRPSAFASSQPIEQPIENTRINTPRRSKVKLAIRHRIFRHPIVVEKRERRPVCPDGVELRQSRDVLEFRLSGIAQPGIVDGAQNIVLLRWADVDCCWERWIGEVAGEFGLDFEVGYGGCLKCGSVLVGM